MTMKPLTKEQKAWIEFTNQGSPTIWSSINIAPSMFFSDQFMDRMPPFALLSDLHSSGISIPSGRNDIDKLNAVLRLKGLHHELSYRALPRAACALAKNEANLSEAALMKLNRYALEAAFMACPPSLTIPKPISWKQAEGRFEHFFRHLNTSEKTYFDKFIYVFNFYEQGESRADWHIHSFIQRIDRSLTLDLQAELGRYFGNCKVCPHYEHGVIFKSDFLDPIFNLDLILSTLVEKGWLTLIDYSGKPGYALNQPAESIKDDLNNLFPYDAGIIYSKLKSPKDGARYIAKKEPSENLEFRPFKISTR